MSTTSAPPNFNYAHYSGIESVPAAVVFCIVYVPCFLWFLRQSFARPTYVYIILAFFSVVRIVAFALRALLAGSESAGENLHLLIAEQIIYSVGFFGLIYSAYTLVLDRESLTDLPKHQNIISRITRNRSIFRIALVAAVALGVTGTCEANLSSKPSDITLGNNLRRISIYIFLALTILLALQTLKLTRAEVAARSSYRTTNESFGFRHGVFILLLISVLLLVREAFFTATSGKASLANKEVLWYPLAAATELICVVLLATPGLVPPRSELPT